MLKDIGESITDMASIGLLVGRKVFARVLADERDIEPGLTARLVDGLHPERVPVEVAQVTDETPSTRTLRLTPLGRPVFPFRSGQFVTVFVTVDGVHTSRAYSISSPPSRPYLEITVRRLPGGFVSRHLVEDVKVGDTLEVSGPAGFFYHEPLVDTDQLVFLAGGSGITPFMSMMREAVETRGDVRIQLIYGSRTPDDVIFFDELSEMAVHQDNIAVHLVLSEPPESYGGLCGLLDAEMIDPLVGDIRGKTFFMCGPHAMYSLCTEALSSLGVPPWRVKKEASGPPPDIRLVEGWPREVDAAGTFTLKIADTRKRFDVTAGEPLLNSLERNGVALDNLCRSGECGVCRAALVEGGVFMPEAVAVRKADLACGYIHPCMAYPVSDLTLRL